MNLLEEVRMRYMFREANSCANKLARAGIGYAQDMEFWENFSNFICKLVRIDNKRVAFYRTVG